MTKAFLNHLKQLFVYFEKFRLYFFIPLVVFSLLLIRNPFSERSLIPNLEPFPDSFHYILPARCFITMNQWNLCRPATPGRSSDVAPLYSATLIPLYLLSIDPRMFFLTNVVLAIGSFLLLHLIFQKLKVHSLTQFSVLLLAATSYHLYWYPTLPMAENLIIFLFLLSVWLLFSSSLKYRTFGIFVALGFYATKYAFAPLTMTFLGLHLFNFWQQRKKFPPFVFYLAIAAGLVGLIVLLASRSIVSLFNSNFFAFTLTEEEMQKTWFSLAFIPTHLPQYIESLLGRPTLVLWDTRPLVPWYFSVIGVIGLFWGSCTKRFRLVSIAVLLSIFSQFFFISSFYAYDSRYTLHILYSLLIGVGIAVSLFLKILPQDKKYLTALFPVLTFVFLSVQAPVLRKQLAINLKYAETPWYYVATKHIDSVVSKLNPDFVAAAFPVYFFDFYTTSSYTVLPVSVEQERTEKPVVYGTQYQYEDIPGLYIQLLTEGKTVYLSNYGLGNQAYMHEAYAAITASMEAQLISEGCHGACNVYKLSLKNASK